VFRSLKDCVIRFPSGTSSNDGAGGAGGPVLYRRFEEEKDLVSVLNAFVVADFGRVLEFEDLSGLMVEALEVVEEEFGSADRGGLCLRFGVLVALGTDV
jgi:hypothetical protein